MPLSEEQTLIRDMARAFAGDKLAPNAAAPRSSHISGG